MSVGGAIKARVAFKRLETDAELQARIHTKTGSWTSWTGKELDSCAEKYDLRRRIVEDEA